MREVNSIKTIYSEMNKKNSGITLVALVVTIVVLLILAGVSINLVVGQNGLINRAKEAARKTQETAKEEQKAEIEKEIGHEIFPSVRSAYRTAAYEP